MKYCVSEVCLKRLFYVGNSPLYMFQEIKKKKTPVVHNCYRYRIYNKWFDTEFSQIVFG